MVGGSLQLPPPLTLVAMTIAEILLKVALEHQKSNQSNQVIYCTILVHFVLPGIHLLYNSSTIHLMYNFSTIHLLYNSSTIHLLYNSSTIHLLYNSSTIQLLYNSSIIHLLYNLVQYIFVQF